MMGGSERKARLRRKLLRYLERDDYSKLKSFIRKHRVDIATFRFADGDTLLHVACSLGQDHTARYFLKKGADVLATNVDGESALHKACLYAQDWPRYAYEDLVMPLLEWQDALDISDKNGITPRQLLETLAKSNREHAESNEIEDDTVSDEEEYHSSSQFKNWNEKLAEEMQDEYLEGWGKYEQDYLEQRESSEAESYDRWASRMSNQYQQKHKRPSTGPSADSQERKRKRTEAEAQQKKFQEKLEQEHAEYIRKNSNKDRNQAVYLKKKYEKKFANFLVENLEQAGSVGYRDIPWPYCKDKGPEGIKEFLLCDIHTKDVDVRRKYLKEQQVRWHPDRFRQKFNDRLKETDRDKILNRVKEISQVINGLISEESI